MIRRTASLPLLATMALVACEGIVINECASPFPLGEAADAIFYMEMVGCWECREVEEPPDETDAFRILRFSDTEYLIETLNEAEGPPQHFRAYVTVVDNVPFLNVQPIERAETEDRGYLFFRLDEITVDRLLMRSVHWDETMVTIDSPEKIREFIQANVNNEEIYDEPYECLRTREPGKQAA